MKNPRRALRWPALFLLLVLLGWWPTHVPGYVPSAQVARFNPGQALATLFDPLVVLIAVGAALLAGGLGGARTGLAFLVRGERAPGTLPTPAASRFLAAAGRGLLWGTCALNLLYLVSFLVDPRSGGLLASPHRIEQVKFGALLSVILGALVLLPAAEAARSGPPVGARSPLRARWARAGDALATLGLFLGSLTLLLYVLDYRLPVAGAPGGSTFLRPSLDGIDAGFALGSLAATLGVVGLAWLGAPRRAAAPDGTRALYAGLGAGLAAGVLVAGGVELAGLNHIAASGGQGNPDELRALAGRMCVALACGLLIGLGAWLRPALAPQRLQSAQGSRP